MNVLFEFFFCPYHGLLRPDNLQAAVVAAYSAGFYLDSLLRRLGLL